MEAVSASFYKELCGTLHTARTYTGGMASKPMKKAQLSSKDSSLEWAAISATVKLAPPASIPQNVFLYQKNLGLATFVHNSQMSGKTEGESWKGTGKLYTYFCAREGEMTENFLLNGFSILPSVTLLICTHSTSRLGLEKEEILVVAET